MRKKLVGKSNTKDKTGQRIGSLTVLGPTDQRQSGSIVWKCQCDCGNICYIPTSNLSREHTTSCGCQQYKKIREKLHLKLTGKRFGKLVVLKELPAKNYESKWLCQCDCGKQIECVGWHLTKGIVNSCGCLKMSVGELKINQLLTENNIPFIQEKKFDSCISPKGNPLRFDFYVNNKYLIEYDGEQHFLEIPNNIYTKEELEKIKEYDKIKNQWCEKNNIPLIRINYTQLHKLTIKDIIIQE